MYVTVICNVAVKLPEEISKRWKVKNVWKESVYKWSIDEARKLVVKGCSTIFIPGNLCLREWLLANQREIPEEFKAHNVVFEGTLFFDDQGGRVWPGIFWNVSQKKWVPYLYHEVTKDQKVVRTYNNSDLRAVHRETMKKTESDRRTPRPYRKIKPRMIRRPKTIR